MLQVYTMCSIKNETEREREREHPICVGVIDKFWYRNCFYMAIGWACLIMDDEAILGGQRISKADARCMPLSRSSVG